jgi:S1-C subfamily serine protease
MLLEVKILTGARANKIYRLEKPVISVGRNADVDIRFDPLKDLDVSGRHAEFRAKGAGYELVDLSSTNGTFVNGERLNGSIILRSADTIRFGANGPEVEATFHVTGAIKVVGATEERIAIAVKKQTAGLQRMMVLGLGVVAIGVGAAYYVGQSSSKKEIERMQKQLDESSIRFKTLSDGMADDTALVNAFQRKHDALKARLADATTDEERKQISAEVAEVQSKIAGMIRMDHVAINKRNAPGVALLISRISGKAFAGTAFGITERGLMLTNRHNVRNEDGALATDIAIKFRDDSAFYPARIVKVPAMGDSLDLALIQMLDTVSTWKTVAGIQARDESMEEGASVATIGFPLGYETAQQGQGDNFIAKTTLMGGTISKRTSTILQIDSYAAHGSSGSPVISAKGLVVGVIWGGPAGGGGRIVYAVPLESILNFLPEKARAEIVR